MSSCAAPEVLVAGVVVAFDTTRDPLSTLDALLPAIQSLVVVDNVPHGHPHLCDRSLDQKVTVLVNQNVGGLAGAYNAAIDHIRSNQAATTHILFLDDDTDTGSVEAFLRDPETRAAAIDVNTAAVSPAYIDRATGLRGAHIRLKRFRYRVLPRELEAPTEVSFLINSMSLWRLDAIARIGRYSTRLGVDHVDTDYCLRSALMGYRLVLNPAVSFLHSIGARRRFQFLGRTMQAGGHSVARRRLIARNTVVLARRYGLRFPAFAVLCLARLAYEILGILLAEDDRPRKLWAVANGAAVGLFTRHDH